MSLPEIKTEAQLLTSNEAARWLRVSLSWLAKARLTGTGPLYRKIGRSVRYSEADLRSFVDKWAFRSTSQNRSAIDQAPQDSLTYSDS